MSGYDAVIVPGGFSYGDYLRAGALAHFSPVMQCGQKICRRREICFRHLQRISDFVRIRSASGRFDAKPRSAFYLPSRQYQGRKQSNALHQRTRKRQSSLDSDCPRGGKLRLRRRNARLNWKKTIKLFFVTAMKTAKLTDEANPNGALQNIAGICNKKGNVLGMMPHPERACEELLGSNDGHDIFRSLTKAIREDCVNRVKNVSN